MALCTAEKEDIYRPSENERLERINSKTYELYIYLTTNNICLISQIKSFQCQKLIIIECNLIMWVSKLEEHYKIFQIPNEIAWTEFSGDRAENKLAILMIEIFAVLHVRLSHT